jgi:hypothetical protein
MKKYIVILYIIICLLITGEIMGFPYTYPFAFDKTYYEENNIYQGQHYTILNPYIEKNHRYKVQLHCHTINSDGVHTPVEILEAYRDQGYDALAITDHDYFTPLTNVEGILHIPGVEETAEGMHICNLNAKSNSTKNTNQGVIDDIILSGGISSLAHTFWDTVAIIPIDTMKEFKNVTLVEIENAAVSPIWNNDYPFGELLSLGFHVWATGVDDCHNTSENTFNKCYVEIMADELTVPALIESLREGNFYVRETGSPQITITMDGNTIICDSDVEATFEFLCRDNLLLQNNTGLSSSYTIKGWESFVRVRVSNGHYAWSQPVWIEN